MSFSKYSILIVEDDSHVSRVVRNHLEEAFPSVRVTIAGSAAKALEIASKFSPTIIIWDGAPNERGTLEEYVNCIPAELWSRVIPISVDASVSAIATSKNSHPAIPKKMQAVNSWSDELVVYIKKLIHPKKK